MSSWIDQKYLALITDRLDKGKRKSNTEVVARCPYCGDSAKNQYKRRFGITVKQDGAVCNCFNCNTSVPFAKFLRDFFPDVYNDYKVESFLETKEFNEKINKPAKPKALFEKTTKDLLLVPLKQSNVAWSYCEARKIATDKIEKSIFWTYNFKQLLDKASGGDNEVDDEPRMVIPLRDNKGIVGLQSRSFAGNKRYENHKTTDRPIIWMPPWLDATKQVIVTEGIFDALSVSNGIAKIGVNLTQHNAIESVNPIIYAWDNESHNENVVAKMEKAIKEGHRVFLPEWSHKDLNEALVSGMTETEIEEYVIANSYKGPMALLQFNKWKKRS